MHGESRDQARGLPLGSSERRREWFDDDAFWRELYPVIFTERRFEEAASEVERLLGLAETPAGSAVLDLACGPGRCSIELARRGYRVTGVDRTEFLLQRAREQALAAGVAVEWLRADMRDFARRGGFALVLNLFTSFGYFEDPDEDLLVLRRMLDNLQPGGRCVIDVVGKECLARMYQPVTSEQLPDGTLLEKHHQVRDDWTRLHEEWVVRRGASASSFRYDHALYSGRELRERMERAGFADVRLHGSFDGEPYGPDAVCLLAIGTRPA